MASTHVLPILLGDPAIGERSPHRVGRIDHGELRRLSIEEHDVPLRVDTHDEHIGQLDESSVAPFEFFALPSQSSLREGLLDGREKLLRTKRLWNERIRTRTERANRRVHGREARD